MKLTPASRAAAMIRSDSSSLVTVPKFIVPRHSGETSRPLLPRRW